ncbi:MAG: hypothetical protein RLZZ396_1142 [Planctomycetota bacterium]|jgi:hypothetical protein
MLAILPSHAGGQTRVELHRQCYQKLVAFRRCLAPSFAGAWHLVQELHRECYQKLTVFRRCLAPSAMVSADASNLAEPRRGTDTSRAASPMLSKASRLLQVPGT